MSDSDASGETVGTRWPELIVALLLMALAVLVIADSLRVGIGWADDGPRSGYFPFYIGLLLLVSSGTVLVGQLLRWRRADPEFAERSQLVLVISVFVPMLVYVGLIALLGIYGASALLIGYFMRRHGRYGWVATVAVSVGVPLVFFLVFERWFLVPLPKGPVEHLLGF
ncbi:tripartite tricarboxylate transporter TctB family protein [Methylibium sp.]|uniref:tripartite tricarboxylate transporter TctB family protein n=1 Tax=Methylibium sp. TaxID=2067992 RepID=UPI003D0A8C63